LEEISSQCPSITGATAKSLAERMDKGETFLGLKLAYSVFGLAEDVALKLQSPKTSHCDTKTLIELLLAQLSKFQTLTLFTDIWEEMLAKGLHPPQLPRIREQSVLLKGTTAELPPRLLLKTQKKKSGPN